MRFDRVLSSRDILSKTFSMAMLSLLDSVCFSSIVSIAACRDRSSWNSVIVLPSSEMLLSIVCLTATARSAGGGLLG